MLSFHHNTGILKFELGKEIYERTGLTGTPIRSGGRKHGKERFCMHNPRMSLPNNYVLTILQWWN